jgi:penicillin amidase
MRSSLLRLLCGVSLVALVACRRPSERPADRAAAPVPAVSGTITLGGLSQPVRVVRDRWGVPHIYAMNEHDLFFAQGYVQAQDRLFQMDLWRRSGQGRVSEVLGLNFVERDAATRRVQYRGDPVREWASYGPGVNSIAEAFVSGINARVAEARAHIPEEFRVAGWLPETWRAEDLLNRMDAYTSADVDADVFRARLVAAIGERRADIWFPAAMPYRIPVGIEVASMSPVVGEALRRAGTPPFFLGLAAPVPGSPAANGSNSWVVNGARSASPAPLLANDPHRAFSHPSLRYLVHLSAPGWNVIGAVSPWMPGIAIGHNDRLAWGMTAAPADITDVFVERVNPSNPHQVEYRGRWIETHVVPDPIVMKGQAKPFPFDREYTPNGVLVAVDGERHLAFTMRWSGSEPGAAGELAALGLDRAQSVASFRAALARWKLPVVDVVYATADGEAGHQVAGLLPVRSGWDGALPAPGWTGTYQWRGWRSLDTLPHETLPRGGGTLVSANESLARTSRLRELLDGQPVSTIDDFKRFQLDTVAWTARQLLPLLAPLRASRDATERARQQLLRWDGQIGANSDTAALYVFWEDALARQLVEGLLPSQLRDAYVARAGLPLRALTAPSRQWFEGDPGGARDRLLMAALDAAVDRLRGDRDQHAPAWGSLHTLTFKHPLAITQAARHRYNVGPFELAGSVDTVLSTAPLREVTRGASFREVVDLADWDRAVWINAPGQSGVPGTPHFADLAAPWARGQYVQMAFSDAAVAAVTESTLLLRPR